MKATIKKFNAGNKNLMPVQNENKKISFNFNDILEMEMYLADYHFNLYINNLY